MNSFVRYFKVDPKRRLSQILWLCTYPLASLAMLAFPELARSEPQFGPWVGQAQVGEKLKVNMTVFGLNKDSQSQLKATCMDAWAESEGDELNSLQTRIPLNLDYGKTLDRGGLLTLTSNSIIKDPVVRVHLASSCPLVTFVKTWDLQLDFGTVSQANVHAGAQALIGKVATNESSIPTRFDLNESRTLAASYRKPVFKVEPSMQSAQALPALASSKTASVTEKPKSQNVVTLPQTKEELSILQPQAPERPAQFENIAASKMSDQPLPGNSSVASDPLHVDWAKDPALVPGEMNLMPFVLFGTLSIFMIAFGMWWSQRQTASPEMTPGSDPTKNFEKMFPILRGKGKTRSDEHVSNLASGQSEHDESEELDRGNNVEGSAQDGARNDTVEAAGTSFDESISGTVSKAGTKSVTKSVTKDIDPFSKQLFESFLGGVQSLDDCTDSRLNRPNKILKSSQQEAKSLVSLVSASQNVSPTPWKLPPSFQSLLPASSARDLCTDQAVEARLKCEMGLIELAFLNAQQSEVVYDIQIEELLNMLDAGDSGEHTNNTATAPSDLIKDFVRSRICELDSKQAIEKFTQSLQAMNSSKFCKKFSMANDLWLQFISDLDID